MYIAEYDRIYSPFSSSCFPYMLPSFMPFNLFSFSLDNFQVQLPLLIRAWTWAIHGSRENYHGYIPNKGFSLPQQLSTAKSNMGWGLMIIYPIYARTLVSLILCS